MASTQLTTRTTRMTHSFQFLELLALSLGLTFTQNKEKSSSGCSAGFQLRLDFPQNPVNLSQNSFAA